MHTLGNDFVPPPIHAGGLRYHGMAPMVSRRREPRLGARGSGGSGRRLQGRRRVLPGRGHGPAAGVQPMPVAAPLAGPAAATTDETIVLGLSGNGVLDLPAYPTLSDAPCHRWLDLCEPLSRRRHDGLAAQVRGHSLMTPDSTWWRKFQSSRVFGLVRPVAPADGVRVALELGVDVARGRARRVTRGRRQGGGSIAALHSPTSTGCLAAARRSAGCAAGPWPGAARRTSAVPGKNAW